MTDANFPHAGTISHGTLRTQDLLSAFGAKLKELDATGAHEHVIGEAEAYALILETNRSEGVVAYGQMVLDELTDALDEYAPEGWYFGTHPGDGSDFGYWPAEDL